MKQVFAVKRIVEDPKGRKPDREEIAFGITSLDRSEATPETILRTNRGHWSVETAHCVLDNPHAFDEDGSRIRSGHGPENMACLRRFALTLLRYRQQTRNQPITEQIARLALNPGRVLECLRLTGNTRPGNQAPPPYLIAA